MINGGAQDLGMPTATSPWWQLYLLENIVETTVHKLFGLSVNVLEKKSEALQSPNLFRNSYSFSEVSHIIHVGLEMTACCSNINLSQFSFGFPAMSDCKKKTKNQTTPNQAVSLNWKHLQAWWSALAHGFLPFRRPGTLFATHWRRRTRLRMRLLTLKTMTGQTR